MRRLLRSTLLLTVAILAAPLSAIAQTPGSTSGLAGVILGLSRRPAGAGLQRVEDQLFSGRIGATIIDRDNNNGNFEDGDVIDFDLSSLSREATALNFFGDRNAFDGWVEDNSDAILAILFPAALTESVSGIDVAQGHSQAFLVSTALAAGGRGNIGGRIEYERFDVEASSGNAVQGLFRAGVFAIEGRFAQLNDTLRTRSTNIGVNLHPSFGRSQSSGEWRVGVDGYFNTLYSTSRALDLGSLDYGAGPWAAGRRDFDRLSLSFGGLLLGSKTHIPSALVDEDFEFLVTSINERPLRWDLTFGGAIQYLLANRVSLGGKILQTAPVKSAVDEGRTSQLMMINLAYLVGGDSPVDFGYRFSTGGERYKAHGIFMNANFTF
jgi:hypothetical protein